jgi:enamine deaminase RidA (YjgF/YER057c/UK114 family)
LAAREQENEGMIEDRLRELGIELPMAATPRFVYVPVVLHDGLAWVSGQLPQIDGEVRTRGKVGREVTVEAAQECARVCVLQGLACLRDALEGDLGRIERVVKVTGFVASAPGFNQQPTVIDAASTLFGEILGERGVHARSAIGVAELPRDAPVEIECVVAVQGEARYG